MKRNETPDVPAASAADGVPAGEGGICKRAGCGRPLPAGERGRARRFCSDQCRTRHYNAQRGQAPVPVPPPAGGPEENLGRLSVLLAEAGKLASAVAGQVDAGAVYAMPAALARLPEGLSFVAGGTLLDIRTTWNATTSELAPRSPESTKFHPAWPAAIMASYTARVADHGLGVGLGFNVPGGANVFWPDGWAGRSRIISVDRRVHGFYATLGLELLKQLRVGGGLVDYRATEELVQGIDPTTGTATLSMAGGHASFDVSAEADPFDGVPLTVGVDYKHQAVQNLTGSMHFDVPSTLQGQLQDQDVSHVLTYPSTLQIGASYRPIPTLQLNATFTYNRYSVYDEDRFVGSKPLPGAIVVPRNYHDGYVYRLGAEWWALPQLALRAGFLRDISGMPKGKGPNGELLSDTYSPTLPDSNTWAGAIGVGWSFARNLAVNGAIFYAHMDEVTSSGPVAFPGRYDTHVIIYALGISYQWSPGERFAHLREF
jgi:long-chain fatty acid transport protein